MGKLVQTFREHMAVFTTVFLILLIIFLSLFTRIVIIVKVGEAGVLYRLFFGGTVTTRVYTEGIQFIWPWDKMYIYNARIQEVPHEFDVLTENGLKVHLDLSIRYRPEYKLIGVLHQQVGEDYVNIVVVPEIENVLRVLIGRLNAEEVYTTKQSLIEKAISGAIEQIAQRYVKVDNVIIKKMKLPDSVEESIRKKIELKHRADAYRFRLEREEQEKERKRIEAEGLERFHKALSPEVLHWMGIQATEKFAKSEGKTTIIVGAGKSGLPVIGALPLGAFTEFIPEPLPSEESPETENPEKPEPDKSLPKPETLSTENQEASPTDSEEKPDAPQTTGEQKP